MSKSENLKNLENLGILIALKSNFYCSAGASARANTYTDFAQEKARLASEAFKTANDYQKAAEKKLSIAKSLQIEALEDAAYYADQAARDPAIDTKKLLEAADKADAEVRRASAEVEEMTQRAIEAKNLEKVHSEKAHIAFFAAQKNAMSQFNALQAWAEKSL